MQAADLKNPGNDQLLQTLRRVAAKAISNHNQEANPAADLRDFFSDCVAKCAVPAPVEAK